MSLRSRLPCSPGTSVPRTLVWHARTSSDVRKHGVDAAPRPSSDRSTLPWCHFVTHQPRFSIPLGTCDSWNIEYRCKLRSSMDQPAFRVYMFSVYRHKDLRGDPPMCTRRQDCPCKWLVPDPHDAMRPAPSIIYERRAVKMYQLEGASIDINHGPWFPQANTKRRATPEVGDVEACCSPSAQQVARSYLACAGRPAFDIHTSTACATGDGGQRAQIVPRQLSRLTQSDKPGMSPSPQKNMYSRAEKLQLPPQHLSCMACLIVDFCNCGQGTPAAILQIRLTNDLRPANGDPVAPSIILKLPAALYLLFHFSPLSPRPLIGAGSMRLTSLLCTEHATFTTCTLTDFDSGTPAAKRRFDHIMIRSLHV
jgi:hypothetical protein